MYELRFTRRARRDIDAAIRWRSERHSLDTADRWKEMLARSLRRLCRNPEGCPEAEESGLFLLELKQFVFGRRPNQYRVLFTIESDAIIVHAIRHAARDWLDADDFS